MKKNVFEATYGIFDFPIVNDGKKLFAAVEKDGHMSFHDGKEKHGFGSGSIKNVFTSEEDWKRLRIVEPKQQDADPQVQHPAFNSEGTRSSRVPDSQNQREETPQERAKRIADSIK